MCHCTSLPQGGDRLHQTLLENAELARFRSDNSSFEKCLLRQPLVLKCFTQLTGRKLEGCAHSVPAGLHHQGLGRQSRGSGPGIWMILPRLSDAAEAETLAAPYSPQALPPVASVLINPRMVWHPGPDLRNEHRVKSHGIKTFRGFLIAHFNHVWQK